ncbi:MAG: 50S ribosomal protein L11 methyltransferase, partial [Candidatus Dojkabacteria bacterium]
MSVQRKTDSSEQDFAETSKFYAMSPFTIPGFEEIYLMAHKSVWKPTSANAFVKSIVESGIAENIAGSRVLDIGAGIGPLGLSFLKMGADYVLMTDTNPYAEEAIVTNARLNTVSRDGREQRPIRGIDFDFLLSDALNDL